MKLRYINTIILLILVNSYTLFAKEIYVSPIGSDNNPGTKEAPFASFENAVAEAGKIAGMEPINIWFSEGTYYLSQTVLLNSEFSGTTENPIVFAALPGAKVVIKGSQILEQLKWSEFKDGIYVTNVPEGLEFDQLFVNGERKIRARFPNYDYDNPIRGGKGYQQVTGGTNRRYDSWFTYDPEIFSTKNWKHPETGIVHAFQSHNWGNMQYRIEDINREENKILLGEGGWQLQRHFGIGGKGSKVSWFYIDNIFEELDVAGEWFLDTEFNKLYYFPDKGVDLSEAVIEVPVVKDLIQIKGSSEAPVKYIRFKGFHFTQSTLTFMEKYEPVARGDWAIHRGGAIFMEGTENCIIEDCKFEMLGGNGVFMSGYNRNNKVSSCVFEHTGESAVCFVGLPSAVRFYQTWDDQEIHGKSWEEMRKGMDMQPGPKSPDYPKNCMVENSIMHDFGDFGKQVAGIFISMSHKITASHNTVYNCPRAGICINDGTWGGHIIEHSDIWETVRETGEHGPFNSWGRERQWNGGSGSGKDFYKELTKLDAIDWTIIRSNRIANFRKSISAGNWTIDLDDGSSYYEIYNNLNLGSTIKLRDGMERKVFNNISVSAVPLGWHVWPEASEDEVYKNIFVISGATPGKKEPSNQFARPIRLPPETKWSTNYDYNLYWNVNFPEEPQIIKDKTMEQWQAEGYDLNAKIADPMFVDPVNGDYTVSENSPALGLGFQNFTMNDFGHHMTRIVPFGGEFQDEVSITLIADARMDAKGSLRYTTDGSEPTTKSPIYSEKINLSTSTMVKTRSFDGDGNPIGFTNQVEFKKVEKVIYPSWFSTLLAGEYLGDKAVTEKKATEVEVHGATMISIADDPDLIDASGGYNTGCFIKSINTEKGKMWLDAGLKKEWIIQEVNDEKVGNIGDLQNIMLKYSSKKVKITAVRNYVSKVFKVKIP